MLYHLVLKDDLDAFQSLVNRLCQGGWRPQGGVQVFQACRKGETRTRLWLAQAMVTTQEEGASVDLADEIEDWLREQ